MKTDIARFAAGFLVLGALLAALGYAGIMKNLLLNRPAVTTPRSGSATAEQGLYPADVRDVILAEEESALVVLEAEGHPRPFLVMGIGRAEAMAIKMALRRESPPRPLTSDLVMRVMHTLGGSATKLVIDKLEGGTFFGMLYLTDWKGREAAVDTRPSDGIGVALRAGAPIFIDGKVLDAAGHARPSEEPGENTPDMVEETLRNL